MRILSSLCCTLASFTQLVASCCCSTSDDDSNVSGYAYVANYYDQVVSVIDLSTKTVVSTITVGQGPCGFDITTDKKYLLVANSGSPTVTFVDVSTNKVWNTLSTNTALTDVAVVGIKGFSQGCFVFAADGDGALSCNLYFEEWPLTPWTNGNHNFATEINTLCSIPGQYGICVSCTDTSSVEVFDIDVNSATVKGTIKVGVEPSGIGVTPDGKKAYVADTLDASEIVTVIDLTKYTTTGTVHVGNGPTGVAVSPKGDYAYVTNNVSGSLSVIEVSSDTVVSTITVGGAPYGIAITSDGSSAYVSDPNSDTVKVVDLSTKKVVATLTVGDYPIDIFIKD